MKNKVTELKLKTYTGKTNTKLTVTGEYKREELRGAESVWKRQPKEQYLLIEAEKALTVWGG